MDMFDGVGRRRDVKTGQLVNIGEYSLNGNERNCLLRNNGDGTFTDVGWVNRADRNEDGRGVAMLDYDRDGHVDVLLRNYSAPAQLLRNVSSDGHWLEVKLIGTRSNRDAIGARLVLTANGRLQSREVHAGSGYLSSSSLVQHFGLGDVERVDLLRVTWPSGQVSELRDLAAGERIVVTEPDGP